MNSEQEKELQDFLQSVGFSGKELEKDLFINITRGLPSFTVHHEMNYGQERMLFDLKFIWDTQFNAYRMEKYKATHRNPINIEHKHINGIDTSELEDRMYMVDWADFFENQNKDQNNENRPNEKKLIEQLNKLSEGQNFDGIKIQEELML